MRNDRNQFGGAVLLAFKDDIIFSEPTFLQNNNIETKWAHMEFDRSRPLYVCSIYLPHTSDAMACLEELRNDLSKIFSRHKNSPPLIYIYGDFFPDDIDRDELLATSFQTAKQHDRLLEI